MATDVKPPAITVILFELAEEALLLQGAHALLRSLKENLFPKNLAAENKTTRRAQVSITEASQRSCQVFIQF